MGKRYRNIETSSPYIQWNNSPLEKNPRQSLESNPGPLDQYATMFTTEANVRTGFQLGI